MRTKSSRHLVAPELAPGIDLFPSLNMGEGLEGLRGGLDREMPPLPAELEAVTCVERFIPGAPGDPDVRVLHYTPPGKASAPRPAVLEIHGGGYIIGTADISDPANRVVAHELDCIVIAVDYRLAPETAWPGSLNDNYAALCWLAENAARAGTYLDGCAARSILPSCTN